MEYRLTIEDTPETIPGGTAILLLHSSTAETDGVDSDFLRTDTDRFLVISTRTTAHEVQQKLEHYDVDPDKAAILDTLSIERGYSRRGAENIYYVTAPDDLDGIVNRTKRFLESTSGKRRITVDSITELSYYADEEQAQSAVEALVELLREYDAVGIFHLVPEVHDRDVVTGYKSLFDGVIELSADGTVTTQF